MKRTLAVAIAVAALAATACDSGGTDTAATTTPAAAPAASPPPPPPPPPAAAPAATTQLAGLSVPYATEAEWVAGCTATGLDKTICDCAGKATVAQIGAKGLYTWVWEGYIQRIGMGQVRSKKWFTDNGIDTAGQQKFADAVGKCYVTQ
jgi:hypothetical protein